MILPYERQQRAGVLEFSPPGSVRAAEARLAEAVGLAASIGVTIVHTGIHPLRAVAKITAPEFKKMFDGMKDVLEKGIAFGGDSMSDYRNAFGEKGGFQKCHQGVSFLTAHSPLR